MDNDPNQGQPLQNTELNPVPPVVQPLQPQIQTPIVTQPQPNTVPVAETTSPVSPAFFENKPNFFSKNKSKIKKIVIILLILAILAVGGFFIYKIFFSGGLSQAEIVRLEKIFDPKKPIIIEKDDKFGFISSEGDLMVEPKYDNLVGYVGDYAYAFSYEDYNSFVIDKKGKVKYDKDSDGSIEIFEKYEVWIIDKKLYDVNLKQISPKGIDVESYPYSYSSGFFSYVNEDEETSGIIDSTGKITYTNDGNYVDIYTAGENELDETYGTVELGDKKAIVNFKTGKVVRDFSNDYIYSNSNNVFYICDKDTFNEYSRETVCQSSIYITNDKIAYQADLPEYIGGFYDINNQILTVHPDYSSDYSYEDPKAKYYDLKTKKFLDSKPDLISDYELFSGYKINDCGDKNDSKYGIKVKDKVEIECKYDSIEFPYIDTYKYIKLKANKELVTLKDYDKKSYVLYDLLNKKEILSLDDINFYFYSDSYLVDAYSREDNTSTIYNMLNNKSMKIENGSNAYLGSNYLQVDGQKTITYYNTDFKKIYEVDL